MPFQSAVRPGIRLGPGSYLYVGADRRTVFHVYKVTRYQYGGAAAPWRVSLVRPDHVPRKDDGTADPDAFRQSSGWDESSLADGFSSRQDALVWAAHYRSQDTLVTSIDVLLRLTDCASAHELQVQVDEDEEWDFVLEETAQWVEMRMGPRGIILEYPFHIDDFWRAVEDTEEIATHDAIAEEFRSGATVRQLAKDLHRSEAKIRDALLEAGESPPERRRRRRS